MAGFYALIISSTHTRLETDAFLSSLRDNDADCVR